MFELRGEEERSEREVDGLDDAVVVRAVGVDGRVCKLDLLGRLDRWLGCRRLVGLARSLREVVCPFLLLGWI